MKRVSLALLACVAVAACKSDGIERKQISYVYVRDVYSRCIELSGHKYTAFSVVPDSVCEVKEKGTR